MNFNSDPLPADLVLPYNPARQAKVEIIHGENDRRTERQNWWQMVREENHHVAGAWLDMLLYSVRRIYCCPPRRLSAHPERQPAA